MNIFTHVNKVYVKLRNKKQLYEIEKFNKFFRRVGKAVLGFTQILSVMISDVFSLTPNEREEQQVRITLIMKV